MTRTPPVLTSPSPYTMINPVVSQLLSKRPSRTRLYQYLLWLYPHIHSLPSPSKILHTIATTAFLHELHHETINNSRTLSLLSRVVSSCGTAGSKVMEASSGDCLAIEQELRQWLSLRNPDGVKFYVVKYARRGVYNVRPIFAFDRQWGCKEEWTVEKMDRHPVGAIYLSAELFYGMEECYRSSNGESGQEEEDRRWFDTLLTLSYFREVCRAVAVWAGAKDADGKVANEGWFTWGMPGTGRNGITNEAAVEILQRNIFLGNQIVGLTSCRKHQYLAKRKEEIQFLVQQPGSPVIPSPTTPFPPVILDPHSTEVKFFAHYGPSNLSKGPLKRDGMPAEVGLHHPISVEALHAYLEDTFEYVNFPGKRFKREHDGVHFPDLTWEFGRSWDELCPNWGMNVDGCYEEWVVDGRLGRYRIGGEGKEVEGPWEPVALEVLRVGLDVKEEKESGDEDEDGDDDEDMEY